MGTRALVMDGPRGNSPKWDPGSSTFVTKVVRVLPRATDESDHPWDTAIVLHTADDAAVVTDTRRSSPLPKPFRYCPHSFTSSSHASETIQCALLTDEADDSTSPVTDDDDDDNNSDESSESHSDSWYAEGALVGDTASGGGSRRGWRDAGDASDT